MKKHILLTLLVSFVSSVYPIDIHQKYFKKVVLWVHKLHSHTHSYIHEGFYRAFKHLGYDTLWLDNNDDIRNIDFSGALFITESSVDANMPLIDGCRYVLHNCCNPRYKPLIERGDALLLQVYTHDCLSRNVTKLAPYIYFDRSDKVLYQPWATDLLPYQIDEVKKNLNSVKKKRAIYTAASVGSASNDVFENGSKYAAFNRACAENNVAWINLSKISMEDNIRLTQQSFLAPSLQGQWQCDQGYIPCRIFKTISYGQMGITNSPAVYELFNKKIVYNSDTYQLFYDALRKSKTMTREELFELMDFVRDHHTYINRIETILQCLDTIKSLNPIN